MRTALNHTILAAACILATLSSCRQENHADGREARPSADIAPGETLLSFTINCPAATKDTKSVITGEHFETGIRSILILVIGEDGSWKKAYKEAPSSGYLSTGTGNVDLDLDDMTLKAWSQHYDVYAFANMGDVTASMPTDASGKPDPEAFAYSLPDTYADIGTHGMPMCAKGALQSAELVPYSRGGTVNLTLTLRRLMAKVVISVRKNGMTGGNTGVLNSSAIRVRQVPCVIRPFADGGSGALTRQELYGGVSAPSTETDYFVFSAGAGAAEHTAVTTLYVPENCQGIGPETGQDKKVPGSAIPAGRHALATYLEYSASKSGARDGVGGDLTYKAYLGENTVNDYNVVGDTEYRATLNLSWNGLFFDGDWRVDNSDISDGRRLYLSTTANAASGSFDWGHLRRNQAKELFVNFSRDGGATWVHSAKDIAGWPYGWDLFVDGVRQGTGASGTATGDLVWAYRGDVSRDQLFITPGPASVPSSAHTLQVKSADGRVASNVVEFDIEEPVNIIWSGKPVLVAQRGLLAVNDLYTGETVTEVVAESGDDVIRIEGSGSSRYVGLLKSGDYTIKVTTSTGREGSLSGSVSAPTICLSHSTFYANPDGAVIHTGTDGLTGSSLSMIYRNGSSNLTVRSAGATAVGSELHKELYDELLAPVYTSTSSILHIAVDGSVYAKTVNGYPRTGTSKIGTVTVSPKEASTGVAAASFDVLRVDPFQNFGAAASLGAVEDWGMLYDYYNYLGTVVSGSLSLGKVIVSNPAYTGITAFVDGTESPALASSCVTGSLSITSSASISYNFSQANLHGVDNHLAGKAQLHAYVRNRHDNSLYYCPFAQFDLFAHGAVGARLGGGSKGNDYAYTVLAGDGSASAYSTPQTGFDGQLVTHHFSVPVTSAYDSAQTFGSYTAESFRSTSSYSSPDNHVFRIKKSGNPITPSDFNSVKAAFAPQLQFPTGSEWPESMDNAYCKRIEVGGQVMFAIRNSSTAPTRTFQGKSGCGYYVLHLLSDIQNKFPYSGYNKGWE